MRSRLLAAGIAFSMAILAVPAWVGAQTAPQPPPRLTIPTVTVTAQKEPADRQTVPISVTAIPAETLWDARITAIGDAALFAPNVYFNEFSARKISNARMRGVGSSPANPGITTYIDGVPQLNANASNIEFNGIGQVEFVRGPQSALFGRNTLGGVINVASERPSLLDWSGNVIVPFGTFDTREFRGTASGPVRPGLAVGVSGGHSQRDGFTINTITGNDIDSRSATFGKAQVLWTPSQLWETRVIVSGERARDGDYALSDLGGLRQTPFQVTRDFEGHTHRDIFNTTVLNRLESRRFSVTSTTGIVRWNTDDLTDLDYSPFPVATRSNVEEAMQFTQEVRVASAAAAPIALSSRAALKWQTGVFLFTQDYEQDAANRLAPFVLSPQLGFPIEQHSPRAALNDFGVGLYGQGTFTFNNALDVSVGARFDHERKDAVLETFFEPAITAPFTVDMEETFSNVSPQIAVAYRMRPEMMIYGSATGGFKAGGFNPASPPGSEAFGEEHSWNVEAGVKTMWAGGRVTLNAAAFTIDWSDLQLNLANPFVPAQFYIANVGGAQSRGVEFEINARPASGLDLFGAIGYTRATFNDGTRSSDVDVSGNDIPLSPNYTATIGAQLARVVRSQVTVYGRGEVVSYGAFHYDDANSASQDAYSLANFRVGARARLLFAEAWVKNAFDTRYIPIAFAYPGFAPSGFIGESGRPRTFGASVGVSF
jgi:iron complex outermembrane receptor protein